MFLAISLLHAAYNDMWGRLCSNCVRLVANFSYFIFIATIGWWWNVLSICHGELKGAVRYSLMLRCQRAPWYFRRGQGRGAPSVGLWMTRKPTFHLAFKPCIIADNSLVRVDKLINFSIRNWVSFFSSFISQRYWNIGGLIRQGEAGKCGRCTQISHSVCFRWQRYGRRWHSIPYAKWCYFY